MRHTIAVIVAVSIAATSCSLFKSKIRVEDVIAEKVKIESTSNPAKKFLILNDLKKKRVVLDDIVVKKITSSTNIDYEWCIISDVMVGDKNVECYIYTKNVFKISNLQEGVSRISVVGDFKRFFTMLDEYYTKLEIVQAKVTPYVPGKDAEPAADNKNRNSNSQKKDTAPGGKKP